MSAVSLLPCKSSSVLPPSMRETDLVSEVGLRTLVELSTSLALGALCLSFVSSGTALAVIGGAIAVQLVATTALRLWAGHLRRTGNETDAAAVDWLAPIAFGLGSLFNAQTLIHEGGHWLAARLLYVNSYPKLSLDPFLGGSTTYRPGELTRLGQAIGRRWASPVIAAAGPVLALASAGAMLAAGEAVRDSFPECSRVLIVAALIDFFAHFVYALSALWYGPQARGHDFVVLWGIGIHPIAAAICIAALPVLYTVQSIASNSASVKSGTFKDLALSYLEPGSSPTRT